METLQVLAGIRDGWNDRDFFVPFLNWNKSQETKLLTRTTSNLKITNSLVFRQLFTASEDGMAPEKKSVFEIKKDLTYTLGGYIMWTLLRVSNLSLIQDRDGTSKKRVREWGSCIPFIQCCRCRMIGWQFREKRAMGRFFKRLFKAGTAQK